MRPSTTYLAAVSLLASVSSTSPTRSETQLPFLTAANNADTLSRTFSRVYGSNNATYGPVPKEEQLFQIEFLEIAPSPFEVCAPESHKKPLLADRFMLTPTALAATASSSPG